jgi:hypothetical protein
MKLPALTPDHLSNPPRVPSLRTLERAVYIEPSGCKCGGVSTASERVMGGCVRQCNNGVCIVCCPGQPCYTE